MNVLLLSRIIPKTGVGNHVKLLAEELTRKGHHVIVASATNDLEIGAGVPIEFIKISYPTLHPCRLFVGIREIHSIIKKYDIDVVHCHYRMSALYMKFYRSFWKIPVVYTLHSANIPSDFFHRIMSYSGDLAIGVSSEVTKFLIDKLNFPSSKVTTIFNGVDESKLNELTPGEKNEIKKKYGIQDDKVIFVMHSRLEYIKNHLLAVEAMGLLPNYYKKKYIWVCSGEKTGEYYNKVRNRIAELHLEDNFVFTGWESARNILGIGDALVLPSLYEGFSLSVIEAFFMRLPVFRTETGGFHDQKYCLRIPMDDAKCISQLLKDFIDGKIIIDSESAYMYAKNNFSLSHMTNQTIEVYKKVIMEQQNSKMTLKRNEGN